MSFEKLKFEQSKAKKETNKERSPESGEEKKEREELVEKKKIEGEARGEMVKEEEGLSEKNKEVRKREEVEEIIRNELQRMESKETESKISMEKRIVELRKLEEVLDEQCVKAWKDYLKFPSLRTLKGWREFITGEHERQASEKYRDLMNKANAIRSLLHEMRLRMMYYEDIKECMEKGKFLSDSSVKDLRKITGGRLDNLLDALQDKESGMLYGDKLTSKELKVIEDALRINDATTFEVERAEEIKKSSRELSRQFEEQDIGKGTKIRLDNGDEGWVRSFNREEGILEIYLNPRLTKIASYDVREVKKIQRIKESKSEKILRRVSEIYRSVMEG